MPSSINTKYVEIKMLCTIIFLIKSYLFSGIGVCIENEC